MKPKILLLANYDPNHLAHGRGSLLNNTYRELSASGGIDADYGFLLYGGAEQADVRTGQQRFFFPETRGFRYVRKHLGRWEFLRCTAGLGWQAQERRFLHTVSEISDAFDVAIWFGFLWDLMAQHLPAACRCPVVMHGSDSIWLAEAMRRNTHAAWLRRYLAARQERSVLEAGYAGHIYVSTSDAEFVEAGRDGPGASLSPVVGLPSGVDLEAFRPSGHRAPREPGKFVLLFVGVMNFGPNTQAASILVNQILPLLGDAVTVRIVGRDPSAEVMALGRRFPKVVVTGAVVDVVAEYQNADLFVAPLEEGAGMKNKVLEALACGLPVLTTPAVKSAFGRSSPCLTVAGTPAEFAAQIRALQADRNRLLQLSAQARPFVEASFSWERRTKEMIRFALECAADARRCSQGHAQGTPAIGSARRAASA